MIHVQGLTKSYKQVTALADIDLAIAAGECFGLVGTNGAGRTTLLNILATVVRATTGRVTIAGLDVARHPWRVRRRMGYVAESHSFYDELQVYEYLDFIASTHRLPAPHRRAAIDTLLASTHLDHNTSIRVLSKGCRQQLALVAALLHEPDVLLLDEPLLHLDPVVHQRWRALLQERRCRGTTLVLACNAMEDLQELCGRIGVLHRGRLVQVVEHTYAPGELAPVLHAVLEKHVRQEP